MSISIKHMWADPKPGHEISYFLALKHRSRYMEIFNQTPCWQFGKQNRRWIKWKKAVDRGKIYGQHRIETYKSPEFVKP
jgi:hypothetical protein